MSDINVMCRICLNADHPIEGSITDEIVQLKLVAVFPFFFHYGISFPTEICGSCLQKINEFYDFSEQVRNNQEQLKDASPTTQAYVKDEPTEFDAIKKELQDGPTETVIKFEPLELGGYENEEAPELEEDEAENGSDDDESNGEENPRTRRKEKDRIIRGFFTMKCDLCGLDLKSYQRLKYHYLKVHGKTHYFRCCGKVFKRKHVLLNHIALHVNPDEFKCDICNKNYRSKDTLKGHMLNVHNDTEGQLFKCDQCHLGFSRQYMLEAHLKKHDGTCHDTLDDASVSQIQRTEKHTKDNQKQEQTLNRNPENQLFVCQMCGKGFNKKCNLKYHIKNTHIGESVTCELCGQGYPNKKALRSHKIYVHVENKFECDICGKRYKRHIVLKHHYATHSTDKEQEQPETKTEAKKQANTGTEPMVDESILGD